VREFGLVNAHGGSLYQTQCRQPNRGTELALVLYKRRKDSVKIYLWQLATEGFKFLKMTSFLTIQIPHEAPLVNQELKCDTIPVPGG
jgi:hypothetical protein